MIGTSLKLYRRVDVPDQPRAGLIHVVVVSDVRLYREGLASGLARRTSINVRGATDHSHALSEIESLQPDVVVFDRRVRDGLEIVRAAGCHTRAAKIIVFGVEELDSEVVAWAEAGVAGYVTCDASLDDLGNTIEGVARNESPCSAKIVAMLLRRVAALGSHGTTDDAVPALTSRERQILPLIHNGLSNKEIAQQLHIEVTTVKNHVHNLLAKLNVKTRNEAATRRRPPTASLSARAGTSASQVPLSRV